jgi:hypothetical protein
MLVDDKGNITVKSDKVRQALEYLRKLAQFLPPDAPAWDDASNNKWLVAGNGALIMSPPSAWAVAKRDAPQIAEQCWTHGFPSGPNGRFAPFLPYLWGIWSFSKNKEASKSLLRHLSTRDAAERMVAASAGYDLPSFEKLTTFKTWAEEGPPKGTLYHYPNPHNHQTLSVAGGPAPPRSRTRSTCRRCRPEMIVRLLRARAWIGSVVGRVRGGRLHAHLRAEPQVREGARLRGRASLAGTGDNERQQNARQHMVDVALQGRVEPAVRTRKASSSLRRTMQRKSTTAFLMALPLILLIALLVVYPAIYSMHLATLNKSMQRFVGFDNFLFLFKRQTFWLVVQQSCVFAITAVIFKAIIGFIVAHSYNIPAEGSASGAACCWCRG